MTTAAAPAAPPPETLEKSLKDLNLSNDEMDKLGKAFKDPEFLRLFEEYAKEVSDPKVKAETDLYLRQIEAQGRAEEVYGKGVQLVTPVAGFVLKSKVMSATPAQPQLAGAGAGAGVGVGPGGVAKEEQLPVGQKVFINICTSEKVERYSLKDATDPKTGRNGKHLSVPMSTGPKRVGTDKQGQPASVYDIVLHPESVKFGESNRQAMNTVAEMVQRGGVGRGGFDDIMPFWIFLWAAPLELAMVLLMVSLELDFLSALAGVATSLAMIPLQSALVRYIGGLRRNTARCTDERVRLAGEVVEGALAMKMMSWEVYVPGRYHLAVPLPYGIDEAKSKAKFDKARRQLEITLPVLPPPPPPPQRPIEAARGLVEEVGPEAVGPVSEAGPVGSELEAVEEVGPGVSRAGAGCTEAEHEGETAGEGGSQREGAEEAVGADAGDVGASAAAAEAAAGGQLTENERRWREVHAAQHVADAAAASTQEEEPAEVPAAPAAAEVQAGAGAGAPAVLLRPRLRHELAMELD
ncbi:Protein kintoun [Tetrabaena socialis]|uniref:PIH1 domain-containing protein 1 n=1 Tax=Tetrabaena socialis TaxID=47790 RepID=A0A2J7ZS19_9CHLO|nr:Protein kintoun [Tetrabaena socialis]|eukprot:PNH03030.1 Protein kintoun [Tetrabaena socialis]